MFSTGDLVIVSYTDTVSTINGSRGVVIRRHDNVFLVVIVEGRHMHRSFCFRADELKLDVLGMVARAVSNAEPAMESIR